MARKYIICAPPPSGSAGVRALYILRDALARRGFDAKVLVYGSWWKRRRVDRSVCARCVTDCNREHDVVVYSETVWGNPLRFKHVARWILNDPGKLGGETSFPASECVFAWVHRLYSPARELRVDVVDRSIFRKTGEERSFDAVFTYKGGCVRETPELKDAKKITMRFPKTRRELATLLQRARTLYSHDDDSVLLLEAEACGAKVKVITERGFRDWEPRFPAFDQAVFERQIGEFVSATQNAAGLGETDVCEQKAVALPVCCAKWLLARLMQLFRVGRRADMLRMRAVQEIFLR